MSDSFHDDSDTIAPVDEFATNGGDWTKSSDEEADIVSSPSSDWGAFNDASRQTASKPSAASTRTTTQSKPSVPTYSSKDEVDESKASKKDGDTSSTKHKQPSRRSSGHQNSSSSIHDDRLKSSMMSYNSRSSHSSRSSYRRNDRDATLGEVLTVLRTLQTDFNERCNKQDATIARLENEIKELKELAYSAQDGQDELKRICQAWDDQYSAQDDAPHSDEGSQFAEDSAPQPSGGSSDTAYDASREVSHAPADEQPPVRDAETSDQEMRSFEDDDHKSVKSPHDDEHEPSRKRQRVDGADNQQNGTQTGQWVSRYAPQQGFMPPRKNHHPYNNNFNNQRGGFRGRGGRPYVYQNQGHHAPPAAGPYPQGDFNAHSNFRPQHMEPQFPPHNNVGPAFAPRPQNNGAFNAPAPPPPRRNNPPFIPNPDYVPNEDMAFAAPQVPSTPMHFNGPPPPRGVKRPFPTDMQQQFGGEEYMQQPPAPTPPRPQWQQGTHGQQGVFQQRFPRRQQHALGQSQPQQQPRQDILARFGGQ